MWSECIISCPDMGGKYKCWIKHFEEGSRFGIENGKISKLTIRKLGETRDLCHYDRGWCVEPVGEVKAVYAILLLKYN